MLVVFTLSTGQKKVAINPQFVARVEDNNSTSSVIVQTADPNNKIVVMGSFEVVLAKLSDGEVK